jgi:hypothetical protein
MVVEIITIGLTWMMNNDDSPELAWRIVRLILTGGFAYWWIENAWALGMTLMGSFDQLGREISNTPGGLTPLSFINVALSIVKTLWAAPSGGSLIANVGLDVGEFLIALFIMIMLALVGVAALFALASAMLILGPGSFFVSFMPCRFTSALSENYFNWLVRSGAAILGFYVVLATAQHFVVEWNVNLAAACGAAPASLPFPHLGAAPTAAAATTCTKPIEVATLLTLVVDVMLVAILGIGIPVELAAFAGGGIGLALEHLASAKYLVTGGHRSIQRLLQQANQRSSQSSQSSSQRSTLQQRLAAGAAAAAANPPKPPTQSPNAYGVQPTQALPQNGAKPTSRI